MSKAIRYVRDYLSGNSTQGAGGYCHWVEIAAWDASRSSQTLADATSNRAYLAPVTANFVPSVGLLSVVTDGLTLSSGITGHNGTDMYVQVDLGALRTIEYVQVWHYWSDNRVYYNHRLDVSADGSTWITVNPPEGAVKETEGGTSYYLPTTFMQGQAVATSDLVSLQNAINAARAKRNISAYAFQAFSTNVGSAKISELRLALADISMAFTESFSDNDTRIEARDIDEVITDIYKYMGGGTCTSGCTMACRASCDVACGSVCASGCANGCTGGCAGSCGDSCHSGCFANCAVGCGAACTAGCGTTCTYGCSNTCKSGCNGGCSGACSNAYASGGGANGCSCGGNCSATCGNSCVATGCGSVCAGGCSTACHGGCGAECAAGCGSTCNLTCGNGCARGCGAACNVICSLACSNGCETACTGTCQLVASALPTS